MAQGESSESQLLGAGQKVEEVPSSQEAMARWGWEPEPLTAAEQERPEGP